MGKIVSVKKKVPLSKLLAKAQKVFNAFIRNRDQELGCISCGGEVAHAGHYMNQGQHSLLRFNEHNTNGQCIGCNLFKHGNLIRYRQGLVKKIGEDAVTYLEDHSSYVCKWTREELEQIIEKYAVS